MGVGLLNLATWVRQQAFLRTIYGRFPQGWRDYLTRLIIARVFSRARFPRTQAWVRKPSAASSAPQNYVATAKAGMAVNILGYIRGQFGLAESARLYASALIQSGAQVRLYDIDLDLPHSWEDRSLEALIGEDLPHRVSIIFVNPDYLQEALKKITPSRLEGHHVIACWFWELERVPEAWIPAIDKIDEIMVASEFIERAFRKVTDKPILLVPQPMREVVDSGLQRVDFGLEEGKFIFLVAFDFNSWVERKNPYAALNAFRLAFPSGRDDVRLLIKTSNGFRHLEKFNELLNAAARDARIIVRDQIIDRVHLNALQRCVDAYVSLHRAEGFGLGLAECMAIGKPVIATGWSGNTDFMNESNSCLVGFRLVPVGENEYPGGEGEFWAEAALDEAADYMRRLVDEPGFASMIGAQAAHDVSWPNSVARAGEVLSERLRALTASQSMLDTENIRDAT